MTDFERPGAYLADPLTAMLAELFQGAPRNVGVPSQASDDPMLASLPTQGMADPRALPPDVLAQIQGREMDPTGALGSRAPLPLPTDSSVTPGTSAYAARQPQAMPDQPGQQGILEAQGITGTIPKGIAGLGLMLEGFGAGYRGQSTLAERLGGQRLQKQGQEQTAALQKAQMATQLAIAKSQRMYEQQKMALDQFQGWGKQAVEVYNMPPGPNRDHLINTQSRVNPLLNMSAQMKQDPRDIEATLPYLSEFYPEEAKATLQAMQAGKQLPYSMSHYQGRVKEAQDYQKEDSKKRADSIKFGKLDGKYKQGGFEALNPAEADELKMMLQARAKTRDELAKLEADLGSAKAGEREAKVKATVAEQSVPATVAHNLQVPEHDRLINAHTAAQTLHLNQMVKEGKLTQWESKEDEATFKDAVTMLMRSVTGKDIPAGLDVTQAFMASVSGSNHVDRAKLAVGLRSIAPTYKGEVGKRLLAWAKTMESMDGNKGGGSKYDGY